MYCHLGIILLHLYHYFTNLLHAPMLTFHSLFLPLCPYGIICRMMFSLLTHLFVPFFSVSRLHSYRISILLLYVTHAIGMDINIKKESHRVFNPFALKSAQTKVLIFAHFLKQRKYATFDDVMSACGQLTDKKLSRTP